MLKSCESIQRIVKESHPALARRGLACIIKMLKCSLSRRESSCPALRQGRETVGENGKIQCAVFTSASTVKGFVEGTPGLDYAKVRAACIGKQTKAAADAYGMKTYMAKQATMDSLVDLVIQMKEGKKDGDDETSPAIEGK